MVTWPPTPHLSYVGNGVTDDDDACIHCTDDRTLSSSTQWQPSIWQQLLFLQELIWKYNHKHKDTKPGWPICLMAGTWFVEHDLQHNPLTLLIWIAYISLHVTRAEMNEATSFQNPKLAIYLSTPSSKLHKSSEAWCTTKLILSTSYLGSELTIYSANLQLFSKCK